MNMNRRDMLKTSVASGAVVMASASIAGCNASQWIQTALADLPVVIQIITSILSIAGRGNPDPAILAKVSQLGDEAKKDLALAQSLIQQYQSAPNADTLSKIETALTTALNSLQAILTAFHVVDPGIMTAVAAALGSAITVVLAIQSLLPMTKQSSAVQAKMKSTEKNGGAEVIKEAFHVILTATGQSN
jgi:hypothetical protein